MPFFLYVYSRSPFRLDFRPFFAVPAVENLAQRTGPQWGGASSCRFVSVRKERGSGTINIRFYFVIVNRSLRGRLKAGVHAEQGRRRGEEELSGRARDATCPGQFPFSA